MTDRLPPHDLEAEINVLGSMLLDPFAATACAGMLRAADFYRPGHGEAFAALCALSDRSVPADPALFHEELLRRGALEAVGGTQFISKIAASVPSAANAEHYAAIVRDRARRRALIRSAEKITESAHDPGDRTVSVLLGEAHATLDAIDAADEARPAPLSEVLADVFAALDASAPSGGNAVSSGLPSFDAEFGRFAPGAMVVIAARPSVGKTSFATSIAVAAAKDGRKVLFFSLEVTRERLVLNMLCMEGRVDSGLLLPGQVIPNSAFEGLSRGIDVLSPLPLLIDDSSADPATLRAKCLRQKSRDGLDLVVVDYLGLVDTSAVRTRSSNRENEVAWLSQRLKELAKELKVPLIALSQLNRLSMTRTDHRPLLSDLRDSGCIEQDADVVLLLHREERCVTDPRKRQEVAGQAELIVAKNRNGPIGTLPLAFDGRYFMFSEISSGRSARS